MFYSHQLLSKKGALGTIWFAAHSHKKLKKEDVSNTNISSSVGKQPLILHSSFLYCCPLCIYVLPSFCVLVFGIFLNIW